MLELTTDRYPPITSQARYPLRLAASIKGNIKHKTVVTAFLFHNIVMSVFFQPLICECRMCTVIEANTI